MATLAGLFGFLISIKQIKDKQMGTWRWILPVLVIFMALVGARILNFILNPNAYGKDFPSSHKKTYP